MEKKLQQRETSCLRIVLYGPESTGKTTLAKALAVAYHTSWVPEFARDYLQQKWDLKKEVCDLEDLLHITEGQLQLENQALETAKDFLFCDTNVWVTKLWSETHFDGYCAPEIQACVDNFSYDYYFLTNIDVPWEKDDLRDQPNEREALLLQFEALLKEKKQPYTLLSGSLEERLSQAKNILTELKKNNALNK